MLGFLALTFLATFLARTGAFVTFRIFVLIKSSSKMKVILLKQDDIITRPIS